MKIDNKNQNITFRSKNSPIAPTKVYTSRGPLYLEEIQKKDIAQFARIINEMDQRSLYRFREFTLKDEEKEIYSKLDEKEWLNDTKNHFLNMLNKPDGNTTILVAKNEKSKIKAFFSMQSFDEYKSLGLSDTKIGYIDNGYIDFKYLNQGVEQVMLYKIMQTAKGHFTDIISKIFNISSNVYMGVGLERMDETNPVIKSFLERIRKYTSQEVQFGDFHLLSKSIDSKHPWLKRIAKML